MSVRLCGAIIEYDLTEAAMMLKVPPKKLHEQVQGGQLRCFYRLGNEYQFHDASLEYNRLLLSCQKLN